MDITDDIDISIREVKDVEYECPQCHLVINCYDVNCGEYNKSECPRCGQKVKFFINDWL
jgi:uncharacterized paraquat-inducible protein A